MAVIISNGAVNLSTASGFYRVEASNMSMFSLTMLSLSAAKTQAVTFANAGNCRGIVLCCVPSTVDCDKSIVVDLQEFVASVWTTRVSVTLTVSQLIASASGYRRGEWIIPFEFATPYAITTAGSTWRFQVSQTGGTTGNWQIKTSNGTVWFYAAWCDNLVSFVSNTDCVIAKDVVTIDGTNTLKGAALATGDSANSICGIACRTLSPATPYMFKWVNPPAASYTLTLDGWLVLSSHAGFQAGTPASVISIANKAIITIKDTPTLGTSGRSGFCDTEGVNGTTGRSGKHSLQLCGEIPTYKWTKTTADIAPNTNTLTTQDTTGWAINDTFVISKCAGKGYSDLQVYTISNIAGTSITFTPNLTNSAFYERKAGAYVIRDKNCGVILNISTTNIATQHLKNPSNFYLSGVCINNVPFNLQPGSSTVISTSLDEVSYRSIFYISDCLFFPTGSSYGNFFGYITPIEEGMIIQRSFFHRGIMPHIQSSSTASLGFSGDILFQDNVLYAISIDIGSGSTAVKMDCLNNIFHNLSSTYGVRVINLSDSIIESNDFWGSDSVGTYGSLHFYSGWKIRMKNNIYANNGVGIGIGQSGEFGIIDCIAKNEVFSSTFTNTIDLYIYPGMSHDIEFFSETGNLTIPSVLASSPPSLLRFSDFNDTTNDDRVYTPKGNWRRCGPSLSDTTVRTAGGYSLRGEHVIPTKTLSWAQDIPVGNIQNKTMSISIWVNINNAAFYGGTHTKPTLTVNYDNGTELTAVALGSTGWQRLTVTFTPVTTFPKITVTISSKTDQTGTNSYVYWDDMNVAYPAGVQVDLGTLDYWSNAFPAVPSISTFPSLGGVWDEALSAHTSSGTFGNLLRKALTTPKFLGLK